MSDSIPNPTAPATGDIFEDFLSAVETLHRDNPIRITAHTSSVSADGWATETANPPTASR